SLERDRLDMEEQAARAEVERLKGELDRIAGDVERETRMAADAEAQLTRLGEAIAALEAEIAAAPERGPELDAALVEAETRRAQADGEVERLAGVLAAAEARANAETARKRDAEARQRRAAEALAAAQAEREALGALDSPEIAEARAALDEALAGLNAARAAVEAAETARAEAGRAEGEARTGARQAEDRLGRLQTAARGLAQLLTGTKREFPPALDQVRAARGYEAALAAALGDDLDAALDARAPAHWAGAEAPPPAWPDGVEPLAAHVEAPPALAARLAYCAVAPADRAAALAAALPPGARLTTVEGDLYRWDGLVSRADAPRPAAVRLAQRARLDELESEIDRARPGLEQAQAALAAASEALRAAAEALKAARRGPPEAEQGVARARDRLEALSREQAPREARARALDETIARLTSEAEAAEAALAEALQTEAPSQTLDGLKDELAGARAAADAARSAAAQARADRDAEARER